MKALTMEQLIEDVREGAREADLDIYGGDSDACAREIADGLVPIYTADLLELASQDLTLADEEPGFALDGGHTAVNAIAGVVYERLYEVAIEELEAGE